MTGFYLMHRGWMEHDVFADEAFTEREAWEWMIAAARWEDGTVNVLGNPVRLSRGQFSHSVRFMAQRFKWSKSSVDRFLDKLAKWDMIGTANGTGQLVVTIRNYSRYQDAQQESGTPQTPKAGHERDKEEINKTIKQVSGVVDARADTAFRKIYDAGCEAFPQLATRHTEIINRWIAEGADPERDVLPIIKNAVGVDVRKWEFFTYSVMGAIAARTKPLPEGKAHAAHNRKSALDATASGFAEAVRLRATNRDRRHDVDAASEREPRRT